MTDAPIFAVGDIHGQAGMLAAALDRIAADPDAGAPVVFLGDYVDRGPDTRGVIDLMGRSANAQRGMAKNSTRAATAERPAATAKPSQVVSLMATPPVENRSAAPSTASR